MSKSFTFPHKAFLLGGLYLAVMSAQAQAFDAQTPPALCSFVSGYRAASIDPKPASTAVDAMVQRIVEVSGLAKNFEVNEAQVPNAAAFTDGSTRRVLYNSSFVEDLALRAGTKWAPFSVLAHEVGHHLNGHTLDTLGSRPRVELEADLFSGFVLQRLGASLGDAQSAIALLVPEQSSATHPGKSARLRAVALGWSRACKADVECALDDAEILESSLDDIATDSPRPPSGEGAARLGFEGEEKAEHQTDDGSPSREQTCAAGGACDPRPSPSLH